MEYHEAKVLSPAEMKACSHPIRMAMLEALARKPSFPSELAAVLKVHEQTIYYHLKSLLPLLEIDERKEIRGTIAKRYRLKERMFVTEIGTVSSWKTFSRFFAAEINKGVESFLDPILVKGNLQTPIVVGSTDPHGPFKAIARDGHYAVDLALFLGQFCSMPPSFSVKLDVEIKKEKRDHESMILVGGPVTNVILGEINEALPVTFVHKKTWELVSRKTQRQYSDDAQGVVAKIPHPLNKHASLLVFAGIRFDGTKAAILALTRHHQKLLADYTGQKIFCHVVHGFDLDSDGEIDSVEIVE